jgi:hypothetical protein
MNRSQKILLIAVPLVLLLAVPFPLASKLEERDSFCISCHLAPEETYHQRAQAALAGSLLPADLASAHYGLAEPFRCIDCHRGDGSLPHRWQTFLLGARDALTYAAGQADETVEKGTTGQPELLNAGCAQCHADSLLELGFNNHFHNQLEAARRLGEAGAQGVMPPEGIPGELFVTLGESGSALGCLDCHRGHVSLTDGDLTLYLDVEGVVFPACVQCHEETGHGPLELR